MIRHIVAWRLSGEDAEAKAEQAEQIAVALRELPATIHEVRRLTVGRNVVAVDGNWDLALVVDFDSVEDLAAYQEHPDHVALVPMIRSRVVGRACVDLEV